MADQAGVLHQPLEMLGAHEHDLLRIEAEEHFLEGWPLGVHQAVLEAGAEDPQADQRQVAVVAQRAQLGGALRLRQARFQRLPGAEAVQAVFVHPGVVAHRESLQTGEKN